VIRDADQGQEQTKATCHHHKTPCHDDDTVTTCDQGCWPGTNAEKFHLPFEHAVSMCVLDQTQVLKATHVTGSYSGLYIGKKHIQRMNGWMDGGERE